MRVAFVGLLIRKPIRPPSTRLLRTMATDTSSSRNPEWLNPATNSKPRPTLKLYNSLTKSKSEFVSKRPGHISWYNCGPTVYDAAHMGHARTYLSMDIIRRVLQSYFGYNVQFVQNVTDIDDKIILRARQEYLFQEMRKAIQKMDTALIADVKAAWERYLQDKFDEEVAKKGKASWPSLMKEMTPEVIEKHVSTDEKFKMKLTAANAGFYAIEEAITHVNAQGPGSAEQGHVLVDKAKDVLCEWLDKEKGSQMQDPAVFRELPAYWEDMYFKDMKALNVLPPSIKTRVSEYVPEIITYVEKIIANGYAYAADGSVYFDTASFDGQKGHCYAKIEPWSKGNKALIEDGEGSLGAKLQGKRSPNDFALWKASKPGEPVWDSPWGKGRPGWHIECSVMASAVLGDNMDIHSGGIDLAFPHHDNELAQAEAYFDCYQWVNYFLHAGHLHVEGQKMSKSLKNFITIQEALKEYSARQLRIFFLLHQWNARMDYKKSSMHEAIQMETTIKNFFDLVNALTDRVNSDGSRGATTLQDGTLSHRIRDTEKELLKYFHDRMDATHESLCDSINTAGAMSEIMALINQTNKYMTGGASVVNVDILQDISSWVSRMLDVFGVEMSSQITTGDDSQGEFLMQCIRQLSSFRDQVRQFALDKKDAKEYLSLCDELRDTHLIPLGIILDDQKDGKALVKLTTPEEAIKSRDEKIKQQNAKAAKANEAKQARLQKAYDRLLKGKQSPEDLEKERLAAVKDGEMSKSQQKKLIKDKEAQVKMHEEYSKYAEYLQKQGLEDTLEGFSSYQASDSNKGK